MRYPRGDKLMSHEEKSAWINLIKKIKEVVCADQLKENFSKLYLLLHQKAANTTHDNIQNDIFELDENTKGGNCYRTPR